MLESYRKKSNTLIRTLRYLKRKKAGRMIPLRVSKAELNEIKSRYDSIIEQFVSEMAAFRESACSGDPDADFLQKESFTDYEILSFNGDRMGKVFRKDGEIYRGIYSESCADFREMWRTGLLQILSRHGWIPKTVISGYYTEEYPIILRHQAVDMNSSKLWSCDMIREAAIRISLIRRIAEKAGFTLHDGHMNNITFHEGRPVFTDIGSFVKDRGQITVCNKEILFSGCYRCVFSLLGNFMLARSQTYDESNNMIWITPRYYDDLTEEYRLALRRFRAFHRFRSSFRINHIIHRMFDCWDVRPEYIDALFPAACETGTNRYSRDTELIADALRETGISFSSAVDTGGTDGYMSLEFYKEFGVRVTDCETDDAAGSRAYALFRRENIPGNVLSFHYLYGCDPDSRKSVMAELATCADITHNVFSVQQYRVDSLLNSLGKMATKYVALTYYPSRPASEKYIRKVTEQGTDDTQEFIHSFEKFFDVLLIREYGEGLEAPDTGLQGKEDDCLLLVGKIR